jgi:hypothetical protein
MLGPERRSVIELWRTITRAWIKQREKVMKVCPVCNESFGNDLNFCDIDGAKLRREHGTTSARESNKAWSLLGVGLVLGAVLISAASIVFFPKARIAPTVVSSETAAGPAAGQPAQPTSATEVASAVPQYPEVVVEETPAPETKKKDKAQPLTSDTPDPSPDPKAAALEAEESGKAKGEDDAAASAPAKVEAMPTPKTVSETRETNPAAKAADPGAELKKDTKQPSKSSKDSDKSDGKKDEEKKDKKKKGGLFGVFKKIFGKN